MSIKFEEVQKNVSSISNRESYNKDFLYELMAAYGRSASSITKLRNGDLNVAENKNSEIIQRGVVYFKEVPKGSVLYSVADSLKVSPLTARFNPRFIIVTDYENLVSIDTKKSNITLSCKIRDLDRNIDFFWGWTGEEKIDERTEAVVDKKAAEKMKLLYEEVEKVNSSSLEKDPNNYRHELNLFFTRLLFCFFAEDTKVFSREEKSIFTNSIKDFTHIDGSDLDLFLSKLFFSLNNENKSNIDSPFSKFPYVNGSLFDNNKRKITVPKFNAQARKIILECGSLNWAEINPDIFGSMFQGIVDENYRSIHGMHYTSVTNIMKTLEPLFLDEIREDFDKNFSNPSKLQKLLARISKIKIFDPACGSGNFLIIAYKELRKLEHAILQNLLSDKIPVKLTSSISLDNFYGIEIDDFAHEIAILSLYIAKHQMNVLFEEQFGKEIKLIPLTDKANIILGNSARIDWNEVCENKPIIITDNSYDQGMLLEIASNKSVLVSENKKNLIHRFDEIYLVGNPPYRGARLQNSDQKKDFEYAFDSKNFSKNLDYIAIWFYKASRYIKGTSAKFSFVSTSSICEGEQVELIWKSILSMDIEIFFAYLPFKWVNFARDAAGVVCIILGLRNKSIKDKYIFNKGIKRLASNINPYLIESGNTIVSKRSFPISDLPKARFGSMPNDGGFLILSQEEKVRFIKNFPESSKFIKKFIGADDFINGKKRFALWISDSNSKEALKIPYIFERVEKVKNYRLSSKRDATKKLAASPWKFGEIRYQETNGLVIPSTTSDRREYIPIGFIDSETIVSNAATVIYTNHLWVFGVISSKMHTLWLRHVGGHLGTGYRYSASIVWNTFPIYINSNQKTQLEDYSKKIILARESYPDKSLSDLYDPDKMPKELKNLHKDLDLFIDKLYSERSFASDEDRLSKLFSLYEEMVIKEYEN